MVTLTEGQLLARRYQMDVSNDGTNWVPFKGIQDFAPSEKPTVTDTTDFDTDGFVSNTKTLTEWTLTVKAKRPTNAGVMDPGQEIVRATQYQFGGTSLVYVRWYDRDGQPDAWQGIAVPEWTISKSAVADVEEITVKFDATGPLTSISNPVSAANAPVISVVAPSGAGAGVIIQIQGAYFTGTTGVKFGGSAVAQFSVVSDSFLVVTLASGTAGSAPVVVTNSTGSSAAFPYTRAA